MVDKIFLKQLTWNDLFTRHTFFSQDYKYYLCITSSSKTKEAQSVWSGLVESKLRHLVGALDRKETIAIAHPFPKGFERVHHVKNDAEADAVKNGATEYQAQGTKTETTDQTHDPSHLAAAQNGAEDIQVTGAEQNGDVDSRTIYTTSYYIGLELKPLQPGRYIIRHVRFMPTEKFFVRFFTFARYFRRRSDIQVDMYFLDKFSTRH
jgi:poly(A) polymerase